MNFQGPVQNEAMTVCGVRYEILKLLGHGKGGYSYLVTDGEKKYTLKQIHHEPCDYYTFGDKLQSELNDYERLNKIGIPLPALFAVDREQECIIKEYIEGPTVQELVDAGQMEQGFFDQIKAMCTLLYAANTNIDYYPTNFIVRGGKLVYIDYECNDYMQEWDFEHWGAKYWGVSAIGGE